VPGVGYYICQASKKLPVSIFSTWVWGNNSRFNLREKILQWGQAVLRSRNYLFRLRLQLSKSFTPASATACTWYLLTQLLTKKSRSNFPVFYKKVPIPIFSNNLLLGTAFTLLSTYMVINRYICLDFR
jgi:hypothetical protein